MPTRKRPPSTAVRRYVAANLAVFLKDPGISTHTIASKTKGVSQKTVGNLSNGIYAATIDVLDEVAKAVGVPAWQMLLPRWPENPADLPKLAKVVEGWLASNTNGRELLEAMAKREIDLVRTNDSVISIQDHVPRPSGQIRAQNVRRS